MTDGDPFSGDGCVRHGDEWLEREDAAADAALAKTRPAMHVCILCHNAVDLDDVVIRHGPEVCVCLRCYSREVDNERILPLSLRRQVQKLLREMETR